MSDPNGPAWVRCDGCEDQWCVYHQQHAFECACPPVEDWTVEPYCAGGLREALERHKAELIT